MALSILPRSIAIIGGTGKEGTGLAYRWAKAGFHILIGSRSVDRALSTAEDLRQKLGANDLIEGKDNIEAAGSADVVVLAVPYSAHRSTLESIRPILRDQLIIDVTVPLVPPRVTQVHIPSAGSVGLEDQAVLGPDAQITTAFQNISSGNLLSESPVDCDVLVTGVNQNARDATLKLVAAAGFRGWDAGGLENSIVLEGLTSILIHINKHYHSGNAGIRITGVDGRSLR